MFIQTEATPNPNTLKFLPGQPVVSGPPRDFTSKEEAEASPLARRLFELEGVRGVFLGPDFISVTRSDDAEWTTLKPAILGVIMEHYLSGEPAVEGESAGVKEFYDEKDAEIVRQIKELLDTRVRPAVAQDGGDITFQGYKDGVVYLQMVGACSGCPSATATLKQGVENLLRHFIPQIQEVQEVSGPMPGR
ncbi:NifU family protein [Thermopetrobacter sp. TC1]|uniref:NifU family protein n=1 Tax=Thermopetrobacter sp. TC1 TaxID=1495045 RepID=UPI00057161FF|nr:NifU family protein [Thermopetrobacter sp. TC1]